MLPSFFRSMMLDRHRWAALLAFILSIFLVDCGAPGPPLPPSLELPRPVTDLHATRKGDKVYLSWTVPAQTMDYHAVRHLGPTRICRSPQVATNQCVAVGEAPPPQLPKIRHERGRNPKTAGPAIQAGYADALPADLLQQDPTGTVSFAVEVLNDHGRSAGLSNQVSVPLAPTLPSPGALDARVAAEGIVLTWNAALPSREFPGIAYLYRIYRRGPGEEAANVAGEVPLPGASEASFVDRSFEWQKAYQYHVTAVTVVAAPGQAPTQVEAENSPSVQVFANDIFPPGIPSGLQAVSSGAGQQPFVDLTWAPSTEPDLAGYNVYRHEANGQAHKINSELVKTPAYRDNSVRPGTEYFYSVSALDLRGNESERSEEASEVVP